MSVSRRKFLKVFSATTASAMTWGALPYAANAANSGNGTKVLFINLNGGLDGLAALQPNSGALYSTLANLRPTLALDPSTLLAANSQYSFHPSLTTFKSLYDQGQLSAVLKVSYKNLTRSHLDAEVAIARGVPDRNTAASSGFLNRLGAYNGWSSLQAVSVTGNDLAFEGGEYRGVQARSLQDFYFKGFGSTYERTQLVNTAYSVNQDTTTESDKTRQAEAKQNFSLAVDSTDIIHSAVAATNPTYQYPNTQYGRALKDIHTLFTTSNINTQVGYVRVIGFDTHSVQQAILTNNLNQFDASMSAFVNNMKAAGIWNNLIIMVLSEMGRTNAENGSQGTDHGGGSTVFLLGGAVQGGNIYGTISTNDLTSFGWLPLENNIVEIYRRILVRMGLDPNPIFAEPGGPALTSLFT